MWWGCGSPACVETKRGGVGNVSDGRCFLAATRTHAIPQLDLGAGVAELELVADGVDHLGGDARQFEVLGEVQASNQVHCVRPKAWSVGFFWKE